MDSQTENSNGQVATPTGRFEMRDVMRTCTLKFEGDFEGATVDALLDVPTQLVFELGREFDSADPGRVEQAMRRFGDAVFIGSNVDVDGEPVEASADGFMSLPPKFVRAVFQAWTNQFTEGRAGAEDVAPLAGSKPN